MRLVWDPARQHGRRVSFYDTDVTRIHRDLLRVPEQCGVDTIEVDAVEVSAKRDSRLGEGDMAIENLGWVAAADTRQSSAVKRCDPPLNFTALGSVCPPPTFGSTVDRIKIVDQNVIAE